MSFTHDDLLKIYVPFGDVTEAANGGRQLAQSVSTTQVRAFSCCVGGFVKTMFRQFLRIPLRQRPRKLFGLEAVGAEVSGFDEKLLDRIVFSPLSR